jgi:hypothetical protein
MASDKVRIWDNQEVLGEAMVSEKTKIVVSACIRDGIRYIGLKQWYQTKEGEWKPGFDWCCFATNPYTKAGEQLPDPTEEIVQLIYKAHDMVATMELFNEQKAVYKDKVKK